VRDTWITNTIPIMTELTTRGAPGAQGRAADGCWIDRAFVLRWGFNNPPRSFGAVGIWMAPSVDCAIVGPVTAGGTGTVFSSGMHWPEGTEAGGQQPFVYRAEAHSIRNAGFLTWQTNSPVPPQRIVDMLTWRNGEGGLFWGGYSTFYWAHQVRAIGNGRVQLAHLATNWGITGFLADGLGVPNAAGIEVGKYVFDSERDTLYEDGVVRNVSVNVRHGFADDPGTVSWVQFARVAWDAGKGVVFGVGSNPPNGSYFRFREQRNLPRASNFTLRRISDPQASGATDNEYNARRVDNDTQGTVARTPRIAWSSPADESVATGSITLTVQSEASEVEFYQANRSLGRVRVLGGFATLNFNMASHPHRRAYFWAAAYGSNGAVNATRVFRVMKF
ncbi:MAG: hypothetical protein ACRDFW_11980, partial [bacterium]